MVVYYESCTHTLSEKLFNENVHLLGLTPCNPLKVNFNSDRPQVLISQKI
jgi:hypothetical protein